MKWMLPALIIIIGFVFCMGCTSSPETIITNDMVSVIPTVETLTVTVVPTIAQTTTPIPTATPMPVRMITPEPTLVLEEEPIPDWTEAPVVIPTANPDINRQNFTKFKNRDFMAEYPDTWAVINQSIELKDTTMYNMDMFKKEGRLVTFSSEDGNVQMNVLTYDFISPDRSIYNPTIDTARRKVQLLYPNASADTSVYNYQYRKNEQEIISQRYDVLFKPGNEYYPYSYTEETWKTYNHYFTVDFVTKTGGMDGYIDLRYKMMKFIVTEGKQTTEWW